MKLLTFTSAFCFQIAVSIALTIIGMSKSGSAENLKLSHALGDFTRMKSYVSSELDPQFQSRNSTLVSYRRVKLPSLQFTVRLSNHDLILFRFNTARSAPGFALFQGVAYYPRLRKRVAASADLGRDQLLQIRILEPIHANHKKPLEIKIDTASNAYSKEVPVIKYRKIAEQPLSCGVLENAKKSTHPKGSIPVTRSSTYKSIDIYVQADSVFHQAQSDALRTMSSVFNDAEVLYARDLGMIFNLTIDTTPRTLAQPVGYDQNYEVTTFNELRNDLSGRSEDLVFLLVGTKPQNFVGIANQIGAVCGTPSKHYALGYYYDGAYLTVAHEIGHLFGAEHYNVSPQGIMAGGADAQLEVVKFVDYSKQQIASYLANNSSCLQTVDSSVDYGSISAQFTGGANVALTVQRFGIAFANAEIKGEYRSDANSEWLYYDKFTTGSDGSVSLTIPSPGQYIYSFYADDYSFAKSNILTYSSDGPVTDPDSGTEGYFLYAQLTYKARRALIKATLSDSEALGVKGKYCTVYYRKRSSSELTYVGRSKTNSAGSISYKPRYTGQYIFYLEDDPSISSSIVNVRKLRK